MSIKLTTKAIRSSCITFVALTALLLAGCASSPTKTDNICDIFAEKRGWYAAAIDASERWGGPVTIPMAIMYQESSFRADAKPPMRYFLGFIPYGRASSAYGYAQVKTGTWADYQKDIGSSFRDRDDFEDAIDFIFWYMDKSQKRNGVSKWDGYNQYLNYHEGHGGYARGSYKNKTWLKRVAKKVDTRSKTYSAQYRQCKERLDRGWLRRLFF
ncbi:MAG: transglycosylase SLT domain-containing protein [Pseudomonadales bacterium]|nr:transglycosylase SLT domain-containing protein [Pseudomonadales bacterium]